MSEESNAINIISQTDIAPHKKCEVIITGVVNDHGEKQVICFKEKLLPCNEFKILNLYKIFSFICKCV